MAETIESAPALVKSDPQQRSSLPTMFTPRTFQDLQWFSRVVAESDFVPKEYRGKPGNVFIAIQMGAEVGLQAMAALQNIAVINGRPSIWGDAALGIIMINPAYEWHKEWIEGTGDNRVAIFQVQRRGHPLHEQRYSVADAKTAKLWGKDGPWTTYPDRMLKMRARGFAIRDKFADSLRGLIIAEEAQDYPLIEVENSAPPALVEADPERPAITEAEQAARVAAESLMRDKLGFTNAKIAATLGKYDGSTPELMPSKLVEKITAELARNGKPNGNGQAPVEAAPAPEPPKPAPAPAPPSFDRSHGVEQFIPTMTAAKPIPTPEPIKADSKARKSWEVMF